jgi:5,10-methylene-tetrahydrofolate dehydrogenase/methenyl tetrahydrofolate cyclohydrolase
VIDVITRIEMRARRAASAWLGDVAFDEAVRSLSHHACAGRCGPMTIATLLANTVRAKMQHGWSP